MSKAIVVKETPVYNGIVVLEKAAIKADQDVIRSTLTKVDRQIHDNAVQCLIHAEKHGDTSLMVRLLVDSIGDNSGYRQKGLINWMRKHSPMELKGTTINLSGIDKNGVRRPFLIEEANANPFWTDKDNAERVAKPVYRETLMSKIDSAMKEFFAAIENTANGAPINPDKAFYDGIHTDRVVSFFEAVQNMRAELPADDTYQVRKLRKQAAEAAAAADALERVA